MAKKLHLAGCPFCGNEAFWVKGSDKEKIPDRVMCLRCGVEMVGTYKSQSALDAWNFRVADHIVMRADTQVSSVDGSAA